MRGRLVGLVLGAFLAVASAPLFAQQGTAGMRGQVTDTTGLVLPGVTLVVTNQGTGVARELVSEVDGGYVVAQLPPGTYRVLAKLEGFQSIEQRDILVELGRTRTVNLTLSVGSLQETLTVTGTSPLVDLTSAEVGGNISAEEFKALPAATRSYFALVNTVPGVTFNPSNTFLDDSMVANGQAAGSNNITFDGIQNNDDFSGSSIGGQVRISNESVQEIQLMTNQFGAEWGRALGAVMNVVTKSGTNRFAGSAFGYFSSPDLTAKNYFARVNNLRQPEDTKEEWGATFGGPIMKDKLHFFVSLERAKLGNEISRTFVTLPQYNFSSIYANEAWTALYRVDHQVTTNNSWSFRWVREDSPQRGHISGNRTLETQRYTDDMDQLGSVTFTSVLGNSKVNAIRVGYTEEVARHFTPRWKDMGFTTTNEGVFLPPMLSYQSADLQQFDFAFWRDDTAYAVDDAFSWFIADKLGSHDTKFGARYTYTDAYQETGTTLNGKYTFRHDNVPFNAADARTYPERFSILVGGMTIVPAISQAYELYAQDKWQIRPNVTVSAGLRYDLEITPLDERDNPLIPDPNNYPIDKNNLAPRLGLAWDPRGDGRSVVRGGYGIFYDKTYVGGTLGGVYTQGKFADAFVANFPLNAPDPGPSRGQFPTDPTLTTPTVGEITPEIRAYINSLYPPGSTRRNTGVVNWDSPDRKQPYVHQFTVGYQREIVPTLSVSVDYVRMLGRDLFLWRDLNIGSRISTARTARIEYLNPFGLLDDAYTAPVRVIENLGSSGYDALNVSIERRFANHWSLRGAYALGNSRGNSDSQTSTTQLQVGTNLNLDQLWGPADVDRRHIGSISGRVEIPRTRFNVSGNLRLMSGQPFTIHDTTFDSDRNGVLFDPLPSGDYSGTSKDSMQNVRNEGGKNGARGPGFAQLDMRVTYQQRLGGPRTLDFFAEVFNVTNRANFTSPSGDLGNAAEFLRLSGLVATTGFPRQLQFGIRMGF